MNISRGIIRIHQNCRMAGCRDGRLAGSCIRASVAAQQVQARSLDHSLISSCILTVRRAACLVPIGRIISNCHDATTMSIPYSVAYSTIVATNTDDDGYVKFITIYHNRFISANITRRRYLFSNIKYLRFWRLITRIWAYAKCERNAYLVWYYYASYRGCYEIISL